MPVQLHRRPRPSTSSRTTAATPHRHRSRPAGNQVQCYKCYKWSTIAKEEFETVRENFTKDPWFCSRRPDCSCEDVADIEYDSSRVWVLDKPNIPKPPAGTERLVIMRSDYTKMDTYYVMPNGKRARCAGDVDKFLEANPEYKDQISASDFNFAPPKVVEETVSHNSTWKAAKAKKQEKAEAQKRLMLRHKSD